MGETQRGDNSEKNYDAATFGLRLWLGSLRRARELPRLDPLKVAVLLALVLAPLQDGGAAASLRGAWQVMLGE